MPDAGVIERLQDLRMRIAFDGVEHAAGEEIEESLRRLGDDLGPQAIDRIARLQSRHHRFDRFEILGGHDVSLTGLPSFLANYRVCGYPSPQPLSYKGRGALRFERLQLRSLSPADEVGLRRRGGRGTGCGGKR